MQSTPFNPESDLATMPFDQKTREKALLLKKAGLPWTPHVGCFVWDADEHIQVNSPFPGRIYFILNLGHFLKRFDSIDNMIDKLVWLPTHHQARLLLDQYDLAPGDIFRELTAEMSSTDELQVLYDLLGDCLED